MLRSLVLLVGPPGKKAIAGAALASLLILVAACGDRPTSSTSTAGSPSSPPSPTQVAEATDPYGLSSAPWPGPGADAEALLAGLPAQVDGLERGEVTTDEGKAGPTHFVRYGGTLSQPGAFVAIHPRFRGMSPVMSLVAYLAWLKDCTGAQGDPQVLVDEVLILDDPTATNRELNASGDAVNADTSRFAWFSCTAEGEVGEVWRGPRDLVGWVTPDAVYLIEARSGDTTSRLADEMVAAVTR